MLIQTKKIMIACTNHEGFSDLITCTVKVNEEQIAEGEHYELAKEIASAKGYRKPFVCFDDKDQNNIAKQVSNLDCPVPFTLVEKVTDRAEGNGADNEVKGSMTFGWDGICFQLEGYSDYCSDDDQGIVAYMEHWDGSVYLRAYSDVNSEEPTNNINFDGARNENRVLEDIAV